MLAPSLEKRGLGSKISIRGSFVEKRLFHKGLILGMLGAKIWGWGVKIGINGSMVGKHLARNSNSTCSILWGLSWLPREA